MRRGEAGVEVGEGQERGEWTGCVRDARKRGGKGKGREEEGEEREGRERGEGRKVRTPLCQFLPTPLSSWAHWKARSGLSISVLNELFSWCSS